MPANSELTVHKDVARILRSIDSRDGYILKDLDTNKAGFIVNATPEQWQQLKAGQLWTTRILLWGESYYKAELLELIKD